MCLKAEEYELIWCEQLVTPARTICSQLRDIAYFENEMRDSNTRMKLPEEELIAL